MGSHPMLCHPTPMLICPLVPSSPVAGDSTPVEEACQTTPAPGITVPVTYLTPPCLPPALFLLTYLAPLLPSLFTTTPHTCFPFKCVPLVADSSGGGWSSCPHATPCLHSPRPYLVPHPLPLPHYLAPCHLTHLPQLPLPPVPLHALPSPPFPAPYFDLLCLVLCLFCLWEEVDVFCSCLPIYTYLGGRRPANHANHPPTLLPVPPARRDLGH